LENKRIRKPSAYVHRSDASIRRYRLRTQLGFQKPKKDKFFALKTEIWNESYIVWELFQTPIFQLYEVLHGIFQKHIENPKGKHKIY